MATTALLAVALPCSDADNASTVLRRFPLLWGYKEAFADPDSVGPGRSFARLPVFACREHPAHWQSGLLVAFALRLSLERITPQRCRRGKELRQLKREG